jgi:DNA-binding CsgD family transcriptional regulator
MGERPLLDLIGEVIGTLDTEEFRQVLLDAVRRAVPCEWISLNDLSPEPEATVVLIEPPFSRAAHELYATYAFENPLVARYQRTQDGRAYRFSDVATAAELHATNLYREFYGPLGLEYQVAFTLPSEHERVLALALSRSSAEFSDLERDLLNDARPYLIQAYRNALEHSRLRSELEVRSYGDPLPLDDAGLHAELTSRGITPRQAEVLALLATGRSNRAIAVTLNLSERTVQKHLQLSFRKLAIHTRGDAVELLWSLVGTDKPWREPENRAEIIGSNGEHP